MSKRVCIKILVLSSWRYWEAMLGFWLNLCTPILVFLRHRVLLLHVIMSAYSSSSAFFTWLVISSSPWHETCFVIFKTKNQLLGFDCNFVPITNENKESKLWNWLIPSLSISWLWIAFFTNFLWVRYSSTALARHSLLPLFLRRTYWSSCIDTLVVNKTSLAAVHTSKSRISESNNSFTHFLSILWLKPVGKLATEAICQQNYTNI